MEREWTICLQSERDRLLPLCFCRSRFCFHPPFFGQCFHAPDVFAVLLIDLASLHVTPRHVSVLSVYALSVELHDV